MNVNEMRDRVLEISHDEAAPDNDLKGKALRWLNSAYHELIDECMPYLRNYLELTQEVKPDELGKLALDFKVASLVKIINSKNNASLKQISKSDSLTIAENSASNYFYLDSSDIYIAPSPKTLDEAEKLNFKVAYLPVASDLVDGMSEANILLPSQFHSALIWGALVWSAVYERGFASSTDIALFQRKWDEAKRNVKLSLSAEPAPILRVKAFDIV